MSSKVKNTVMPITFEKFKQSCTDNKHLRGVLNQTVYKTPQPIYAVASHNGIKCEIKPHSYTFGNGCTDEELQMLRDELVSHGYGLIDIRNSFFSIKHADNADVLDTFWNIIRVVENLAEIVAKQHGIGRKLFTKAVSDANKFEKIAKRYKYAIDNEDQELLDLARNLLSSDSMDRTIIAGYSTKGSADSYREHLVPCIMIHNKAIAMLHDEGKSIADVAKMIEENLIIVRISNEEQELLDSTLKLRTTMPEGWEFGDSPYARLNKANIQLSN